jgi:hypothetical protein
MMVLPGKRINECNFNRIHFHEYSDLQHTNQSKRKKSVKGKPGKVK